MPSWKKIITSGSSTAFHHITASGNISTSCEATMSTGLLDLCGPLQIGPSGIVRDPAGNDVITLATNTVDMTALTVGGGFGSTGVTVTSAGAISANGALTCSHGQFPVISVRGQGGIAISLGTGANFISDEGILTSRRADSDAADTDIKSTKFTKADDTEAGFFAFNEQELKVKEHHLLSDMDKDLAVKKQYRIQIGGSADANEVADFQEERVKISVPLTASSDISASGKIIAADAQFGLGTVIIDGANITMSGQLSSSGTGTNILGGDLDFDGDRTIGTVGANDDITINPEAKLILGSSGTDVVEIGRQSGTSAAGRTEIYANTSTVAAKFSLSQITFNHPVTGSTISASGGFIGDLAGTASFVAADAITGASIADDAINSEHYTDGSIDTAHIADDAVTGAKIENNPTIAGNLTVNGNTTLGNAADDTLTIAGNITASRDIRIAAASNLPFSITSNGLDFNPDANGNGSSFKVDDANTKTSFGGLIEFEVSANKIELGTSATQHVTASGVISASGGFIGDLTGTASFVAADAITGDSIADNAINSEHYTDGSIDTAHIADAQVTLAKIANAAANTVIVRDANSSGVLSAKAVTNQQILIGDGTGFTAAALSGDATMANNGAVTLAAAQTSINSILATDLVLGEDAQTKIDFETADEIHFDAANAQVMNISDRSVNVDGGAITSSGDISSSADLYGTTLYSADGVFHDNDANTGVEFGSDTILIKENNIQSAKFATSAGNSLGNASYRTSLTGSQILLNSAQVLAQGAITASGTISASSFIQTTEIKGGGSGDTQLNVQGQITASKNISSSADIIANRFVGTLATAAQTNITSLGTLATLTVSGKGTFGDLAIETTGTNAVLELERASGAELKLKAQDNQSRITYEGGPLLFDRDESGTNSLTLGVGGHITASGNISASGTISGPAGYRIFSKTGNTDGEGQGDIVYFGTTTGMTAGDIYHWKSDGTWELADCNAAANCDGLLGVALGDESAVDGVLLRGTVTLHTIDGTEAVGDVLYLSEDNTGHANVAPPGGNGDIVRVIGYCLDASNGQIWFDPDKTFVEVTA